jgi:hypothetical protein
MAKPPQSAAERFLAHLYDIFGVEPTFHPMEKMDPDLPPVTALVYRDIPEPGYVTGITYGLSLVNHPDWKLSRPELCISMRTTMDSWAMVAAYVANGMRGECPFTYGSTINFHQQIDNASEMSAFFLFAPSIFVQKEHYTGIQVGDGLPLNIVGLYPIYEEEIESINRLGLKDFWHHEHFDLYEPNRPRILG